MRRTVFQACDLSNKQSCDELKEDIDFEVLRRTVFQACDLSNKQSCDELKKILIWSIEKVELGDGRSLKPLKFFLFFIYFFFFSVLNL